MSAPSVQDGLTLEQVTAFKRAAINLIIDTGVKLNMDSYSTATAIVYLHRFYAAKSLVRNDPFLVAVACLYLGGKVENSPKSVRDVLLASCELRYSNPARLRQEPGFYERVKEQVFYAERALLYALNFQFNVDHPYQPYFEMLKSEPLKGWCEATATHNPLAKELAQIVYTFINDSMRTEACLRYNGVQIATGCIWLAMKLLKLDTHIYTAEGQLWWVARGVQEEHLDGVMELLLELYSDDVYACFTNAHLVPQSATLLTPKQLQQHAAAEERRRAVATANGAAAQQQQAVAAAAAPATQQAAAAKEDDYDDLLADLGA